MSAGERPTIAIIEDVHWADDATLDLIRFLGRRIHDTHILLLLTSRSDTLGGQRRMRRALTDIPTGDILRIVVPLLSEEAVISLSRRSGQDGRRIYNVTAGNAFFVTELLRAEGGDGPPPSVRDAVQARAERLSAGARSVLGAVSIFPRRAEARVLPLSSGRRARHGWPNVSPAASCSIKATPTPSATRSPATPSLRLFRNRHGASSTPVRSPSSRQPATFPSRAWSIMPRRRTTGRRS